MARRGVSLMEVLFAIGVIAVGLFGVLALYPLGLNRVGQGTLADAAFREGQNAVQEFETRGMNRVDRWVQADGSTPVLVPGTFDPRTRPAAYLIDPRFVARHGNINTGAISTSSFPYFRTAVVGGPRMTRITLATERAPGAFGPLTGSQADAVFTLNDELAFDLPKDKLMPPVQQFGMPAGSPLKIKRQAERTVSWMASVTPKIDLSSSAAFKNQYLLSVVVFNRRDPTFQIYEDFNGNNKYDLGESHNERLVEVNQFYGSGLGGGEVELDSAALTDLDAQPNDWLVLMGSYTIGGTAVPIFRWYRVVEAEEELRTGTKYGKPYFFRDVTLQGADWPTVNPLTGGAFTTYATIVSNVFAVYEKTIRLETSGMFTD